MKIMRNLAAAFALMPVLFTASAAVAGAETNVSSGLTATGPGLAAHGYDIVAYVTRRRPTLGRAKSISIPPRTIRRNTRLSTAKLMEKESQNEI